MKKLNLEADGGGSWAWWESPAEEGAPYNNVPSPAYCVAFASAQERDQCFSTMLLRPCQREALDGLAREFEKSPQRAKYRLLKDGQFIEQERKAIEMGTKVHQALETLHEFGLEMVPVEPTHVSERGFPLVYTGTPGDNPVLTCELYIKWYALYLVEPDGTVRQAPLDLDELEQYAEGESVIKDHCWNPYVLQRLADAKDWLIDDLSFDLMAGRWHNEHGYQKLLKLIRLRKETDDD